MPPKSKNLTYTKSQKRTLAQGRKIVAGSKKVAGGLIQNNPKQILSGGRKLASGVKRIQKPLKKQFNVVKGVRKMKSMFV